MLDHPEILIVPLMMTADYFLTVLSQVKRGRYGEHFIMRHFELNPVWQKDIGMKKWVNPRHLLITVLITALLIMVTELIVLPTNAFDFAFGAVITTYGIVLGRHIGNLLTFEFVERNPGAVQGAVTLSHRMVLSTSIFQNVAVALPLTLVAIFCPTPFTVGALVGVGALVIVNIVWLIQHGRSMD